MLDEPAKYMEAYKDGIRKMSVEFGEGTDTLAKGLYDILSASIDPAKALDVLAVSAKAARAGITDTGIAADAITTLLNAYGLSADHAESVSDLLFKTVKKGKCVTGDTRVLLANGEYRRIDSLCGNVEVIAWDGRNFTPAMASWCDMGTKEIVRMRTSFGREIRTTPEHPYLTPKGWCPVEQLKVGDRIALPVTLPFFGTKHAPEGWPALLGYLISEGSILDGSPRVTTTIPVVAAELEASAVALGCQLNMVQQRAKRAPSYDIVAGSRGHAGGNPVIDKLREYGLWGKNCYGKFIPDECFSWCKDDLANLLRALFTGDGWLAYCKQNGNFQLGYGSVSRRLVEDIAHLLLRFGIVTRISKTSMNAWMLETRRYVDIRRFIDFIGIERDSVKKFNNYHPNYNQKRLEELTSFGGTPCPDNKFYRPYKGSGVRDFNQPIFFDRITVIETLPEERVYDLTVPVLHNFVANDIVAHNTTFAELAPSIGMVATTAASAGVPLEELGAAIATMTRNGVRTENAVTALNAIISTFLKPTDEAAKYARKLGFEMSSAAIKSEGLEGIFKKISKLPPDAVSTLFPNIRALRGVLPALRNMEGFASDVETMKNRAGATEEAHAKMAKTLSMSFTRLKQAGMLALSVLGEALADDLRKAAGVFMRVITSIIAFIKQNKKLVVTAAKVVGVVALIAGGLLTLGAIAGTLSFAIGGLLSIVSVFTGVLGFLIGTVGTIVSVLTASISVWWLVAAAVAAVGATFLIQSGVIGKVIDWFGAKFAQLKQFACTAFDGIKAALAAGDYSLAARILWLSLQVAWQKGISVLLGYWIGFKQAFMTATLETFYGALSIITDSWASLKCAWVSVVGFLQKFWLGFTGAIMKAWNNTFAWLAKKWLDIKGMFDDSIDVEAEQKKIDAEAAKKNAGEDAA
ncbi:MAG: phage tail tape measure protein, partial [Victivallaceae bacterium]|nr:phage tail tape measure protein [Victivallaceae bacterium]